MKMRYFIPVFILFLSCTQHQNNSNESVDSQDRNIVLHENSGIKNLYAKNIFEEGLRHVDKREYEKAKVCFLKADSAFPNCPNILNTVGNAFEKTGQPNKAFEYFDKAILVDSNYAIAYSNYGNLLNNEKRFSDAEKKLHLGLKRTSDSKYHRQVLYYNLAYSYHGLNMNEKALSVLDSAKIGLKKCFLYDEIENYEAFLKSEENLKKK